MQAAGGAPLSGGAEPARPTRARRIALLAVLAAVVYILDVVSKSLVVEFLEHREPITVIPGVLVLTVIRNPGASFGIGTGMTIVFTVIALTVVVAILRTARQLRSLPWAITLGLLLGGALGNLTDRLFRSPAPFRGHVVDFVQVFPVTRFPVFNVADSAIVCGGILAVFIAWRGYQIDGTRQTEDEAGDSAQDRTGDGTGDRTGEQAEDRTAERPVERDGERAVEGPGEHAGERAPERADG